ncbi:hypothetical protein L1987_55719 [Smallanthus sonchifolius]|uniref:Uncharacterized protein n=1 Tax=Smallanthus sonchifolius TaxID=185202 RepID=A0ACB9EAN3_9ASTR|nr:hypothetical protein L1987_55719 [Smallanthus sonchifolius]
MSTRNFELEQLDVKTAFLHVNLEEKIYMVQPQGFEVKGNEKKVCLLLRSLYGLKQSGSGISGLMSTWFHMDLKEVVMETKELLRQEFDMKELSEARKILGMEITRDRSQCLLFLKQSSYVKRVLSMYGMEGCKSVSTPLAAHFKLSCRDSPQTEEEQSWMEKVPYANVVGSLMYLMVCTRPDIGYSVSLVSRYISCPGACDAVVLGYSDSDFAKDLDKGRSMTRYAFTLFGSLVSWRAYLQHIVTQLSTEAEYVALTEAVKECIWLKGFVTAKSTKA